jgi:hypothetical protein
VDGTTVSQITATLSQVIDPVKTRILKVRRDAASDLIVVNVAGQEARRWKTADIFLKMLRHDPQAVFRKPLMNHLTVYPETLVRTSLWV